MNTYNNIITAEYTSSDLEIKECRMFNYSYRKISEAIHVCIWNRDIVKKQVIVFTGEDFKDMLLENEDHQYSFPNCAQMLLEEDLAECMDYLDMDEVLTAVKLSGRIIFRLSFLEVQNFMIENKDVSRKAAIQILVNKKKELAPFPTKEDPKSDNIQLSYEEITLAA